MRVKTCTVSVWKKKSILSKQRPTDELQDCFKFLGCTRVCFQKSQTRLVAKSFTAFLATGGNEASRSRTQLDHEDFLLNTSSSSGHSLKMY